MRIVARGLAALVLLGIARALPAEGAGLWLRLAAATAVLLVPGALVARALGRRGASASLVWSLTALAGGLVVVFAAHTGIGVAGWLLLAAALAALVLAGRRAGRLAHGERLVALAGLALGIALWHVASPLGGDALFHLGRVRKLDDLGSLSLRAVDEFRDGGLHPGYAFPLWHGFLALVARLAGVDPALVLRHEASAVAPLALLVSFEAGVALFRSAWAGAAVVLAQVALIALAPGHGGAYTSLALPATLARQVLVPATLALAFAPPSRSQLASTAAAGLVLTLVHPTYSLFLLVPLAGYLVARALLAREGLRAAAGSLVALAIPVGAVVLWLKPIVDQTVSHDPSAAERRRALAHYAGQLTVSSPSSYHLAPEVFGRSGAVAVAALVLVPLAALAPRRRWAAFVLGGSLVVLALELVPLLFTHFSDLVSLSQSRRAAGFLPFAFALAGGAAVLAGLLRLALLPLALGAGIWLQLDYPGDFAYHLEHGGPALATWIAAIGGGAALLAAAALSLRRAGRARGSGGDLPGPLERPGLLAAGATALLVLPVAVHGFSAWSPRVREPAPGLTPGLLAALRHDVPARAVVYSDPQTSYEIAAYAPVYVATAPVGHVADTRANRPYARRADARSFLRTGNLAIPRRYHAGFVVIDRSRYRLSLPLPRVYADGRFVLYRLGPE